MKRYYRFILFFLAITLLFSLVVSLNACSVVEDSLDDNSTEENSPSVDDNTTENPDDTTSEGEKPSVDDTPTEDITPTPEVIDFSKMSYVALGDSITFGADYGNGYQAMQYPYPILVANSLGFKECLNYALSGSTIATNVDDLPSIYAQACNVYSADVISVMGGVNDYNRNVELGTISDSTTDTFYGSLNAICEVLLNNNPDAFIFLMTPYKEYCYHESYCTELNAAGYNLEDYANAVKTVASKYNIPVLDMYNYGQYELEMYNANSDGIHPSQEFVKKYTAPQIAEFIRQNYRGN